METKHTPGEWFAKREGWSTVYIEARIRPGILQEVAACGPTEAGEEQQEANARLIAAAPELLAALQEVLKHEKWHAAMADEVTDAAKAAIKQADVAIAKATGAA